MEINPNAAPESRFLKSPNLQLQQVNTDTDLDSLSSKMLKLLAAHTGSLFVVMEEMAGMSL